MKLPTTAYIDKVRPAFARTTRPRTLGELPSEGMMSLCFDDFPRCLERHNYIFP